MSTKVAPDQSTWPEEGIGKIAGPAVVSTFTNNVLRASLAKLDDEFRLNFEDWTKFIADHRVLAENLRGFWGMDVSEGWAQRAWDTDPKVIYDVVDQDQYDAASAESSSRSKESLPPEASSEPATT